MSATPAVQAPALVVGALPPARRLIAAGIIRRLPGRTLTMRVTQAGVTGTIRPARVTNYDNHGSRWGTETVAQVEASIAEERANGTAIDEWHVTDRDGQPLRIVRMADPTFLDTISVIPTAQTFDDDSDDVCPVCEQWTCRCGTGRAAALEAVAAR